MTLSVAAWAGGRARPVMAAKAAALALKLLAQLADFRQYLKQDVSSLPQRGRPPRVVARAVEACRLVAGAGGVRLTPLAAVAGAVADEVALAAWGLGADKVVVNNGGDLALCLAPGRRLSVGLPLFPGGPLGHRLTVKGGDGVGGVASSGWPGRSFSPGVAEQVAVWGRDGALADAAATCLAGACTVDSPAVTRVPAGELDPQTDVPEMMVTTRVGELSQDEVLRALAGGEALARRLLPALPLMGAHFSVAGHKLLIARQEGGRLQTRRASPPSGMARLPTSSGSTPG
ncbi:MAG: UPF0280 family protein [Pseudomonadota bacterium]